MMPYIRKESRDLYNNEIKSIANKLADQGFPEGDVVYIMYRLASDWWHNSSKRFRDINHIRGALHSTLTEFDRRIGFPYEDDAIARNGDIK